MEEMLQNFTSSGMTDIAFLVVNSKKENSQIMLPRLQARVSFPVYQETSDEEVWNVLGGGKDDMFVYDRCGRLVAFIPFPLSLLDNDQSLVSNFIFYAYNVDPCDEVTPCREAETTTALQDMGTENYTDRFLNNSQEVHYEQQDLTNKTYEIHIEAMNELWLSLNETADLRSNIIFHGASHSSEHISHSDTQNYTHFQVNSSILEIQNLDGNNTTHANFSTTDLSALSREQKLVNETICRNSNNCNIAKPSHTNDIDGMKLPNPNSPEITNTNPKRICVAEDEKVCEQWSKRQLKRIQKCCTDNTLSEEISSRHENMCKPFRKKRCKKLRTVIKCCLKIYSSDDDESTDEEKLSVKQESTNSQEIESHTHINKQAGNAMDKVP